MSAVPSYRVRRRNLLPFLLMLIGSAAKILAIAIFKPSDTPACAAQFSELYSRLWDYAEHSISHLGFSLPASQGEGPVHRTHKLLCHLYGGKYASLSFGGASGAMLTLLIAVLPKLQSDRNLILFDDICHQSTIGGLIFGRWETIRLVRPSHPAHQTASPTKFETVKKLIDRHGAERFAAIILVLPSYDGFRSPEEDKKIYDYAKAHGITVIIDGAWDAMRFRQTHSKDQSLSSICDVWITSPHKRGLTPSSLGCIITKDARIARYWDEALDLGFRSSSISFLEIMIAEHRLSQIVSGDWNSAFEKAEQAAMIFRERIKDVHSDLFIIEPNHVQADTVDPSHVLISTSAIPEFDAREWAESLSADFAFDIEKATQSTLLLLFGNPSHLNQMDNIIQTLRASLELKLIQKRAPHDHKTP